jgi:hypothetical protein
MAVLFQMRALFKNASDKLFEEKMDENDRDCGDKLLN